VTLLAGALEQLAGSTPRPSQAGRSATRSRRATRSRASTGEAIDAAFLLEPTPVPRSGRRRRRRRDAQKSTYFYPKALTGLVINPHEW
jgi:hypothetical protein